MTLRMGLVGNGPWVRMATGPGLQQSGRVEPVGLWGRDPQRSRAAADELGLPAYDDYDRLLADVDAVAFSVAPDAQAELALRAAQAGRHLLLDKPVALDVAAAEALLEVVRANDLAAIVFFTDRFMPASRAWFEAVAATDGWAGGLGHWLGALASTPFGASPWRRRYGAYWDIGPHVLSTVTATLGPVHELTAVPGGGDVVHLIARHDGGVTSTATLSQEATPEAAASELMLWGRAGSTRMPPRDDRPDLALAAAADELAAVAASAGPGRREHPSGLEFGVHVVRLLAAAQAEMDGPGPSGGLHAVR